jgi:hypothetical protein
VAGLAAAMLALCGVPAHADDWPGPQIAEEFSRDRNCFVRVIPADDLGATYGFAGAKAGKNATAEFYRRAPDRSYRLVAEATLQNPVAPISFFVSNGCQLATLDNWHNVGYGKVVALYDAAGKLVRAHELAELFSAAEVSRLTHSVSSIHWHDGPAYVNSGDKTLLVTVKPGGDLSFAFDTGQFKYCEYEDPEKGARYRCRTAGEPRRWLPNTSMPF